MTTFFITHRDHEYNEFGYALAWKRRSKRFLRWLRPPYTVVRPGWLDNGPEALVTDEAWGGAFEVFSGFGAPPTDWSAEPPSPRPARRTRRGSHRGRGSRHERASR